MSEYNKAREQVYGKPVYPTQHKRKRPDQEQYGYENAEPGDNAKAVRFVMALKEFGRVDVSNPQAVEERVNQYFQLCIDYDTRPLVAGLADCLGMDRRRLWDIANNGQGTPSGTAPGTVEVIKRAYRQLEVLWEYNFSNGKMNPVSGIFMGKNHFGYADKQEWVVTPAPALGAERTQEELESRIIEYLPEPE